MGRIACPGPLLPESLLSIGGKEVQVDSAISRKEYLSQKPGRTETEAKSAPPQAVHDALPAKFKVPPGLQKSLDGRHHQSGSASTPKTTSYDNEDALSKGAAWKKSKRNPTDDGSEGVQRVLAPTSIATKAHFKNPVLETTVQVKHPGPKPTPRHDPDAEGALVMKRLRALSIPKGKQIVDVVVDPLLSKHLRDHQRVGVRFLYECIMGMRGNGGEGAILADEMGLGKTLQTIALLWTLLKQNPIYEDPPVIKKALIVCPATLINNWKKEFRKWLGNERIGVFVFDDAKKRITDFTRGRTYSVLIIGYEKLRTNIDDLQKGHGIDIVVADEGHRLKTQQNKAGIALKSLDTAKRIILSGTPIQNDLSEFFSMVDFVNPGALGTAKAFAKHFESPIEKSRQPQASEDDVEKGNARSEELAETTSAFILRRTVDVLSKYLPPKTEYVVLCRPTKAQAAVYQQVLQSAAFQSALNSTDGRAHLQLIMMLRKVCNSPKLLNTAGSSSVNSNNEDGGLASGVAAALSPRMLNADSAKLRVLDSLLHALRQNTSEKIVLASNFTATLDLLGSLLTSLSLPFLRLDGSVQPKQRQDLVDLFNRTPASHYFAFLISAKAGGAGLNLIGASRLVLFDVDWNPATDAQVLARIHRDGQKRPCVVYRFLVAGALDEKIWQRQVTKLGLADSVMEGTKGSSSFTRDELRDLFRLDEQALCQTHELIGCKCGGRGLPDSGVITKAPGTPQSEFDRDGQGDFAELDADLEIEGPEGSRDENEREDRNQSENDDEEEDQPIVGKLLSAKRLDMTAQEQAIKDEQADKRKRKQVANMQSLMSYAHIDATSLAAGREDEDVEALIHDDILLETLKDEGSTVRFVFARTSDSSKLESR